MGGLRRGKPKTQKRLKENLRGALSKGDRKKALEIYLELEAIEPAEGNWPQRAADIYERLGKKGDAIDALFRAVDCYAQAGFLLKGIAVCKRILRTDPDHEKAQATLSALSEQHGLPAAPAAPRASGPTPAPSWVVREDALCLDDEGDPPTLTPGEPLEELLLTNVIPSSQPAKLSDDEPTEGISEISLGETAPPYEPTLTADTAADSQASAPDQGSCSQELEKATEITRHAARRTPLFSSLYEEDLKRLVDGAQLVTLEKGDELFHQGDPGDRLYVVAEGAVSAVVEDEVRKPIAELKEGEFFGEIALITSQPRNATVEALEPSTLLSIDRVLVAELIEHNTEALKVLLRFLRNRLIDRLIQTSPLLAPFQLNVRKKLAERFRFLEVSAGTILIKQDTPTDALFVLLAGEVGIVRSEAETDHALATLRVGNVFGEMSLLTNEPAMACATTQTKSWLLALPRSAARELLTSGGSVQVAIEKIAEQRRHENESALCPLPLSERSLDLV